MHCNTTSMVWASQGYGPDEMYNGKYLGNEAQGIWELWFGCGEIVWCAAQTVWCGMVSEIVARILYVVQATEHTMHYQGNRATGTCALWFYGTRTHAQYAPGICVVWYIMVLMW